MIRNVPFLRRYHLPGIAFSAGLSTAPQIFMRSGDCNAFVTLTKSRVASKSHFWGHGSHSRLLGSFFFHTLVRPFEHVPITLVNDTFTPALQNLVPRSPGAGDTTAEATGTADKEGNARLSDQGL